MQSHVVGELSDTRLRYVCNLLCIYVMDDFLSKFLSQNIIYYRCS